MQRILVVERGLEVGDGRDVRHAVERAGVHGRGGLEYGVARHVGVRGRTLATRGEAGESSSRVLLD